MDVLLPIWQTCWEKRTDNAHLLGSILLFSVNSVYQQKLYVEFCKLVYIYACVTVKPSACAGKKSQGMALSWVCLAAQQMFLSHGRRKCKCELRGLWKTALHIRHHTCVGTNHNCKLQEVDVVLESGRTKKSDTCINMRVAWEIANAHLSLHFTVNFSRHWKRHEELPPAICSCSVIKRLWQEKSAILVDAVSGEKTVSWLEWVFYPAGERKNFCFHRMTGLLFSWLQSAEKTTNSGARERYILSSRINICTQETKSFLVTFVLSNWSKHIRGGT